MKNGNQTYKKNSRLPIALALLGLVAVLSGCGQTSSKDLSDATTSLPDQLGNAVPYPSSGSGSGNGSGTPTTPVGNTNYTWDFTLTGQSGTSTTSYSTPTGGMTTDSVLKVNISLDDPLPLDGTGYTVGYNCATFRVTFNGQSQTVRVRRASYVTYYYYYYGNTYDPCAGMPTTATVDFSGRLTGGQQDVAITVSNATYDNCRLAGGYGIYFGGCTLSTPYNGHQVAGHLDIQTHSLQ